MQSTRSWLSFKQRLIHQHMVRFHMSLILMGVIVSGVLSSKALLLAGVHSFLFRYPVAVLVSYGVFLGLVRLWIWYVAIRQMAAARVGDAATNVAGNLDLDLGGGGGGGGGGTVQFGGGTSGGGGASDFWGEGMQTEMANAGPVPSSGGGSNWLPSLDLDLDLGDDGWLVLVLLLLLVLVIVLSGGYLIYLAPQILPEAAWQAVLASTLTRISKEDHHDWMPGVLRSTTLPFLLVLVFAGAVGWAAHRHCPSAAKLVDVFHCDARR